MPNEISLERVNELLRLDANDGRLFWKVDKARAIAGEEAGTVRKNGYRSLQIDGVRFLNHRLVWLIVHGNMPRNLIDHIDGNRLNNSPSNLRDVVARKNFHNQPRMRANNTTGFKGVTWSKHHRKFAAQIMVGGKHKHLGLFDDPELAHKTYLAARSEINGLPL